jgi:peptidoglycan/xylan/chitin deacetylase (PgdA/CDA1 family)
VKLNSICIFIFCASIIFSQNNFVRKIAVTMDDLPIAASGKYSFEKQKEIFNKLISTLKSQGVPLIGFVNEGKLITAGNLDERKVGFLKSWLEAGFDLGNHTFSHKSANEVSVDEFEKDILAGEKVIMKLLDEKGKQLQYFRHPFLHTGKSLEIKNEIEKFLSERNYIIAPVTIDNSEWIFAAAYEKAFNADSAEQMKKIGAEYIDYMKAKFEWYEKKITELFGREISQTLLIHANRLNADYFNKLCGTIKQRGYQFVTLEEALKDGLYKSENTFIKNGGISWVDRWAITAGKTKEFFAGEPRTPEYIIKYAGVSSE